MILAHSEWNPDPHKISECFVTSFFWVRILFSSFPFTAFGSSDGITEITVLPIPVTFYLLRIHLRSLHTPMYMSRLLHPVLQAEGREGRPNADGALEDAVNWKHLISCCLTKAILTTDGQSSITSCSDQCVLRISAQWTKWPGFSS